MLHHAIAEEINRRIRAGELETTVADIEHTVKAKHPHRRGYGARVRDTLIHGQSQVWGAMALGTYLYVDADTERVRFGRRSPHPESVTAQGL
jgi:hypothetical protein